MCAVLVVFLLAPLFAILVKSVEDRNGAFVGLLQFREYLATPSLQQSISNTLWVAFAVTAITIPLAFTFAYALTRSCMPFKGMFRVIALTPILAPSLLSAISFIQWFGNQGVLKALLGGKQVYGALGIIISSVYATFPHALMIVLTALLAGRPPLVRGCRIAGHPHAAQVPDHHPARREIRPDQRGDGGVLLYRQRLRDPEDHRRQFQRSRASISTSRSSASRTSTGAPS